MSDSIPSSATVSQSWIFERLSKIAKTQDPVARLLVMLNAFLDTRKANNVFHHICALFMLRELTNSQLAAIDVPTEKVMILFSLSFDYTPTKRNPWTLQSEPYEVEQRLRTTHIQSAASIHRLTYCLLLILRGKPQQVVKNVL